MPRYSLDKSKIRILLLENLHEATAASFARAGYTNIRSLSTSLGEEELIEALREVHFLGIRSRTQITQRVIDAAPKLVGIGCFCIGTNQVDLEACALAGVPVFNAPFGNTRSVAELVLGEILLLLRRIPEKNALAHRGVWAKTAEASFEARGKEVGIIGYGHIGSQLGILTEAIGMRVHFYDIATKLALGNATQVPDLEDLLARSDVVCLHVPETALTRNMLDAQRIAQMKPGAMLINASRGSVVDIEALRTALDSGHLGGAALDVFPVEPKANDEEFVSPLRAFDNVILTPHVGGSTMEAQENIAKEVARKLITYSDNGSTLMARNFPEVSLPPHALSSRLLHIHHNRPGIMQQINNSFAEDGINIAAQHLQTTARIGYVVIDLETAQSELALRKMEAIPGTIRARIIHEAAAAEAS